MVKIIIFDINECLDICEFSNLKTRQMLLPTKNMFRSLRDQGYWVATTSGLPLWYQTRLVNKHEIEVDFTSFKGGLRQILESIKQFEKVDVRALYVGHNDEDVFFASLNNITFVHRDEFMEDYLNGTISRHLLPPDTYDEWRFPEKTWEIINIVFREKSVLDVGCHRGWMLNKAHEQGAREVIGIDLNGAHNTKDLNCEPPFDFIRRTYPFIQLIEGDWLEVKAPTADVVICCNAIHYFSDIPKGVKKLFSHTKELLVLETNQEITTDWELIQETPSHWNNRIIKVYKKPSGSMA